jgi:hypothetical protein
MKENIDHFAFPSRSIPLLIGMNGFRSYKWDPWLIICQIVAIQSLYYVGLGFWIVLITVVLGKTPSLSYVFSYEVRSKRHVHQRTTALPLVFQCFVLDERVDHRCLSSQCIERVRLDR